jgi:hypothetical protein
MSEELCYHPYNWHWIRVTYILNDGMFIEDMACFCVKQDVDSNIECQLFKGKSKQDVRCRCRKEGTKVTLLVYLGSENKGFSIDKIRNDDQYTEEIITLENTYYDECIIAQIQFQPYFWKPYRDPNAAVAAGIFGLWGALLTVATLGVAAPAVLAAAPGVAAWSGATGLSTIAVSALGYGTAGGISSYYYTAQNGQFTVNLPTIHISIQEYNNLSISQKRDIEYVKFDTGISKRDLLNKLKNEDINSVRRQYPRLFSK